MSTARTRPDFELRNDQLSKLFDRLPPRAPEAEAALLGCMIIASDSNIHIIGDVIPILDKHGTDFEKPAHQTLYPLLRDLYDKNQSMDAVQLIQELRNRSVLEEVGGEDYVIQLAESVPIPEHAPYYAKLVRDAAKRRKLIQAAGRILKRAYESGEEADELIDNAEHEIYKIGEERQTNEPEELIKLVTEVYEQLDSRTDSGETLTGISTGFHDLDDMLSGLQKGEMIIVAARPSMGKAQPLDAKVLTTRGWTTMGELRIGDQLASVDGEPSQVSGIYPQGRRQVFRLRFADGRSTEACAEHLWRVHYRQWPEPRILSTEKLIEMLQRKRYQNRLWIETFSGAFGCDDDLPIDPWLLGFLLGDGSLGGSSLRFSTGNEDILERIETTVAPDLSINPAGQYDYRIVQTGGANRTGVQGVQANPLVAALRELDLWDCQAHTKFIPDRYLQASRDARQRLMAGLLDADGWVEKWGSIRIGSASERMATDIVHLARSLGGTASYRDKATRYTYQGESRAGRTTWVCNVQHPDPASLVDLASKRDRLVAGRQRQRRLNLVDIEPTRITETQCIAVTHPSRLYITDDFIVTHNTAFALNMAENIAMNFQQPVAVFSLEMGKQQLAQRLLSSRSGVDAQKMRRNRLSADEFRRLQEVVDEAYDAPMYIDDTPGLSVLELRAKARRLAQQRSVKAIFVDYMQLMSSPGAESRQQEVSQISRGIKALARELDVPVVTLSQLNRNPEGRADNRPLLSDLRESGSIEQDADVVMMLHREEYYHKDPQWADENPDKVGLAELIIAKQRNGPTGIVPLHFHGDTTRFDNRAQQF